MEKVIILKKYIIFTILSFMVFIMTGCSGSLYKGKKIITTHYVAYDIAKRIAGGKLSVGLLTKPGSDPHTFSYTSAMISAALKAKLLITNAKFSDYQIMELEDYTKKSDDEKLNLFSELYKDEPSVNEDEILNHVKDKKNHKGHKHENHEDEEKHKKIHKYAHFYNSFWNIVKMLDIILKKIEKIDPKNSSYYAENRQKYLNELNNFYNDSLWIRSIPNNKKEMFFLGHDSFNIFSEEFTLNMIPLNAHISSDKINKSPEFQKFIKLLNDKKPKYIFTPELGENEHLKESIKESLNYKDVEFLEFHSLHNISALDFKNDVSCYDIFKRNFENLKKYILNI